MKEAESMKAETIKKTAFTPLVQNYVVQQCGLKLLHISGYLFMNRIHALRKCN